MAKINRAISPIVQTSGRDRHFRGEKESSRLVKYSWERQGMDVPQFIPLNNEIYELNSVHASFPPFPVQRIRMRTFHSSLETDRENRKEK